MPPLATGAAGVVRMQSSETHDPEPEVTAAANDPAAAENLSSAAPAAIELLVAPATDETLESSGEMEDGGAEILDGELSRLLATPRGLMGAIEALLFASPEPLAPRRLGRVLGLSDPRLIQAAIEQLRLQCEEEGRGVQIIETAGGYQMATREIFGDLILRLRNRKRRPTLSPAALETLAIVAYRQPIIRAEIEAVRGVESSGMLRNLIDMGLVQIVGKKDVLGRPALYGTTESFLQAFGLKDLAQLPPIAELKQRMAQAAAFAAEPDVPAPSAPAAADPDEARELANSEQETDGATASAEPTHLDEGTPAMAKRNDDEDEFEDEDLDEETDLDDEDLDDEDLDDLDEDDEDLDDEDLDEDVDEDDLDEDLDDEDLDDEDLDEDLDEDEGDLDDEDEDEED